MRPVSETDLHECDEEPIHRIGSIRPSGCLLGVSPEELVVEIASTNVNSLFERPVGDVLGRALPDIAPPDTVAALRRSLNGVRRGSRVLHQYTWNEDRPPLATMLSQEHDRAPFLVEALLQEDPLTEVAARFCQVFDVYALARLRDVGQIIECLVGAIRELTGYDRVMAYRFADDGSGHIIAEAARADLESYLGLHYPASDIPAQARALFVRNRVRVIEDIAYTPVPLAGHSISPSNLDLSGSYLRGVSPIHLRYLHNMGAAASLSISLVRNDRLWGMIACHHTTPRVVAPSLLILTEMLSQVLSVVCHGAEREEQAALAASCAIRVNQLFGSFSAGPTWQLAGMELLGSLSAALGASSAALVNGAAIKRTDNAPPRSSLDTLATWLDTTEQTSVATNELAVSMPSLDLELPPGLLAARWDQRPRSWILLFRDEVAHTVTWAGDPTKPVKRSPDGLLAPRDSFRAWKAELKGKALPWNTWEVEALTRIASPPIAPGTPLTPWSEFGASPDSVLLVDANGVVLDFNIVAGRQLALEAGVHRALGSLVNFDPTVNVEEIVASVLDGELWVGQCESFDEPPRSYEVTATPVEGANEEVTHIAMSLRDVSERIRLQAQLNQAQKMESIGQLTGGLAHNFNNLLVVILNCADIAAMRLEPDHPAQQELALIRSTSEDAARIVKDLMSFARQERSVADHTDLRVRLEHITQLLERTIPARIKLETDISEAPLWVTIDPSQFEQVIVNLVINARDAIEKKGTIFVRAGVTYLSDQRAHGRKLPPGSYVRVDVEDTGKGMPARVLSRVFEPFFTTKTDTRGTGLGLSSCHGIVSRAGGHLEARSTVGKGSLFTTYFPVTSADETTEDTSVEATIPTTSATLLLVDDDSTVRTVTGRMLRMLGYEVLEAECGTQGMELLVESPHIDLILTDQIMPGMRGDEFADAAQAERPDLPVVIMSGFAFDNWPDDALHRRFLHKPFEIKVIRATIEQLLQECRANDAASASACPG
ncbi:Bacteriophytochrome [Enhygromyxa salina]|uniref:histidine kinase n=2 Tax=Enhygromyxa salina TaxID=215803 RepID=A0A2S9YAZ1_9BACT|nr:Bacteriophytochrome [Enhygromyxa salina]